MSNLTISNKPLDKDNSKFYCEFFIKFTMNFLLNYFSDKNLKVVEKFRLDRPLRVNRFAEDYYKFKNTKVGNFKNSHIFTAAWNFA